MDKISELDGMSIGDRMKFNYEFPFLYRLPKRLPVIIRLDGKSFHTLSKSLKWKKPFDNELIKNLQNVALELCKEIMNVKLVYLQSDEISFLLIDYENINTSSWYNSEVQKTVSIISGLASSKFSLKINHEGSFDARIFVLPPYEACNYFIWRQRDWERNSLQMLASSHFRQKDIHGLKNNQIQDKLFKEKTVNYNDLPTVLKRGSCIYKKDDEWYLDSEIPIFQQDRNFITRFIPELRETGP